MDIWAICRREHGLSWTEFESSTLAHLEALEDRRAASIRHARFNAALIASAVFNVNKSTESAPVSPFAFIPGFEPDPEDEARAERRRNVVRGVQVALMRLPEDVTGERVQALKRSMIDRLKLQGFEDAEDILKEAYPNL